MTGHAAAAPSSSFRDKFDRPIFIVSTPRSGSTLLFETLAKSPDLFSIWGESHLLIEGLRRLSVPHRNWSSNRLTKHDAHPVVVENLARRLYAALCDRDGHRPDRKVRMLEKTPKNALRVDFFANAWPDSLFIYLYRDPRETLASMMEAWASGLFLTYPTLPTWKGYQWSLLLIPGWRDLIGKPLPEIVAHQWAITTNVLVSDLEVLASQRVHVVNYRQLLQAPQVEIERIARWAGLRWDRELGTGLPLSQVTLSPPSSDKWRRLEDLIEQVQPIICGADERARRFVELR